MPSQWLDDDAAHYEALFDPLTTFPTRALLQDRLDVALAQSVRTRQYVAVFYIPLDNVVATVREMALVVRAAAAALRSAVRPVTRSPASVTTPSSSCAPTSSTKKTRCRSSNAW